MIDTKSVLENNVSWSPRHNPEIEEEMLYGIWTLVSCYITNPIAATFRGNRIQRKIWYD